MPMDPGGMIVDLVRSCYVTEVAPFPNRPDIRTRIKWYFTEPGALPFPGLNTFTSRNWQPTKDNWPPIGEVQGASRTWYNGQAPAFFPGLNFVGRLSDFQGGVDFPVSRPVPVLSNNLPVELKLGDGGVFFGGTAAESNDNNRRLVADGLAAGSGNRGRITNLVGAGFVAGSGVVIKPDGV